MHTSLKHILILLFLLKIVAIAAQPYYFKHYEVIDGLSHNTIHCATQDNDGFMWFGTKNGLNRFDGYNFKWYQKNSNTPYSIGSNFIECINFSDDKLWVGTDSGLYSFDSETEKFSLLEVTENKPILDVESDLDGNIWFTTGDNLYKFDKKNNALQKFDNHYLQQIQEIAVSPNGTVWVSNYTTMFKYVKEEDTFLNYKLLLPINSAYPLQISKIYALDDNTMALGTVSHGAYIYDISNKIAIDLKLTKNEERLYVREFLRNENNLWVGTESGIFIYEIHSKKNIQILKDNFNTNALSDNAIYCLYKDKNNGIWIGTYFRGINYYSDKLSAFTKHVPLAYQNSISGMAVREIHQDKNGNLWIGTEDAGINSYNPKTNTFKHYNLENIQSNALQLNVHGILPIDNEIWVGTFQNGLYIININTGVVKKTYTVGLQSGLKSNFIYNIYKVTNGDVFVMTSSGVHLYDATQQKFDVYKNFPVDYFYTSFLEDSNGGYWAGTYWDGLFYYNPTTGVKYSYNKNASKEYAISNNAINGIFEDAKHNIWITTESGLNLISKNTKTIEQFTSKNGFPGDVFYAISQDSQGKLWLSTANGLVRFDTATKKIVKYTTDNGLLSNQFNYNSAFKDANGNLYFGSVNGLISFNPSATIFSQKDTNYYPVVLTDFKINNQKVSVAIDSSSLQKSITKTNQIKLKHNQSTFSISYAALNFDSPTLTEYSYMLEGLNKEFIDVGNNNEVFFTDLSPGKYMLKLKSKNPNGNWNTPRDMLKITITPPFWASNLAYFVYALLLSLLLYAVFKYYHFIHQVKNKRKIEVFNNEKEKEVYKAKIEFFTNVSHEILTPLTLIKNPIEKLLEKTDESTKFKGEITIIHKNTVRLLDLVQQLLDFRKTEMERLDLSFVETNVTVLLKNVLKRFSSAFQEKETMVTHNLDHNDIFAIIDEEAVKKILSNLVKNAIKYGEKQVVIHAEKTDKNLIICIKNDGDLIPSSLKEKIFEPFYRLASHKGESGTGIGLSLSYSLTELHKGKLKLDTSDVSMNNFVLELPLHQDKEFTLYPSNKWVVENGENRFIQNTTQEEHRSAILLVEDNLDLLDFLAKDLMENYLVLKANNAQMALKILEDESVQLIVSDVMMPGMNGFEFCKTIKTAIETSHIPVVLLTSKNALNAEIEGLNAGADAYVTKPFSMEHLKSQINNLLKNRKSIIEHYSSTPLAHIRSIAHSETDETFINKLDKIILENISDPNLNVESLAEIMFMSRSTLYRKIKSLSGVSPNELINITRLKRAAELLKTKTYKIYEVSEMVGYSSTTSFGRNFQKQFKMSPSEYLNKF